MKIDVFATQSSILDKDVKDRTVVVIDVLRATSTIITALANGCKEVIPAAEIEEAVHISNSIDRNGFLLGGERNAVKIDGFHLSNSPLEYTREVVEGRTVVITTTNGTRAIKKAADARKVLLGGFLNAGSIGKIIAQEGQDVAILCAGTGGKFSIDDILAAGAIISAIAGNNDMSLEIDDLGLVCHTLYESYKDNIFEALQESHHYKMLVAAGFEEDIRFCFQKDQVDLIPCYQDGVVRALKNFC